MQWFILKLSSLDADSAEYALLSKQQQKDDFSSAGWQQIRELSRGKRVILLIPTEEVVLNQVSIPASNQKLLAKAIPFALEDNVAEDVELLHFVYHSAAVGNDVDVAAINKQRLQLWLDRLQDNGIAPHAVLPDVFLLPAKPDTAVLSIDEKRALFRSDNLSGFSTDSALLSALLPKALDDERITSILLDKPEELPLELPERLTIDNASRLSRQCDVSLLQALPLNLLTRFQRKGQQSWQKNLKKWKSVAIMIAMLGVLWGVVKGVENYRLTQQLHQLDQAIATVYADTFPNTRVDSDYRILHAGMEEKLNSLNLGQDTTVASPLELLAAITPKLQQHKDITIKTLKFDRFGLDLAITADSLSKLEKLRAAVDTNGIDAEVVSSTTSANKVESTIKIKKEKP